MADNNPENRSKGGIGLMLGGIFAVAAAFFILTGGELGGEKKIKGDADLPPVASPTATAGKIASGARISGTCSQAPSRLLDRVERVAEFAELDDLAVPDADEIDQPHAQRAAGRALHERGLRQHRGAVALDDQRSRARSACSSKCRPIAASTSITCALPRRGPSNGNTRARPVDASSRCRRAISAATRSASPSR